MDTNRIFTNLFSGWLAAADQAAAVTMNYTKSTVVPCASKLAQQAVFAAGKTLIETGHKLTNSCTTK